MKKTITSLFAMCIIASGSVFAQVTFTDNFDADKDYKADGVAGSIWSGQFLGEGDGDLVELNTTSTDGALTISATGTTWGPDDEAGFLFYKELAGANFDAKVKIVGGTLPSFGDTVFYFMPGLMVRASDATQVTFCQVMAFGHHDWTAVYRHYNAPFSIDSTEFEGEGDIIWTPRHKALADMELDIEDADFKLSSYPWIRLLKEDGMVSSYISAEGTTWYQIWESDRADMDDKSLQVGLAHTAFNGNTDTAVVVFDDFSLYDPAAVPSSVSESNTEKLLLYYKEGSSSLYIKGLNDVVVSAVNLVNIDGKMVKTESNFSGETLNVSGIPAGVYFVQATLAGGEKYSQKVLIY